MIRAQKIYANPGLVEVAVSVDEPIIGVQFRLVFDPEAASFETASATPGALLTTNEILPGQLIVVVSQATLLPTEVCRLSFTVVSSTPIGIRDAIGSTVQAQDINLDNRDGGIIIGGPMQVLFHWQDNNPPQAGVLESSVYQSNQSDPATGLWEKIGTATAPDTSLQAEVEANVGLVYFLARARNAVGEGPASNVVELNTDLPIALENLIVEIV